MNFLAHLRLAGDEPPGRMVGNLGADFIKGNRLSHLPSDVRAGILMHRRVDAFTDCHPVVRQSIQRIFPRWGRYSGILVDMVYDHFLATDWEVYSNEMLRTFLDARYTIMEEYAPQLPDELGEPLLRLIASDRMNSYGDLEGMARALGWLSRRFKRKQVELSGAVEDFEKSYESLRSDFHEFFPQLIDYFTELSAEESFTEPADR